MLSKQVTGDILTKYSLYTFPEDHNIHYIPIVKYWNESYIHQWQCSNFYTLSSVITTQLNVSVHYRN